MCSTCTYGAAVQIGITQKIRYWGRWRLNTVGATAPPSAVKMLFLSRRLLGDGEPICLRDDAKALGTLSLSPWLTPPETVP